MRIFIRRWRRAPPEPRGVRLGGGARARRCCGKAREEPRAPDGCSLKYPSSLSASYVAGAAVGRGLGPAPAVGAHAPGCGTGGPAPRGGLRSATRTFKGLILSFYVLPDCKFLNFLYSL